MTTASGLVTVYNADGWTVLKPTPLKNAVRLIFLDRAEIVEVDESKGFLISAGQNAVEWLWPKAIKLKKWVVLNYNKLFGPATFSKGGVLKRDKGICAYCGGKANTIDHVLPRSRGGTNDYNNTVSCCFADNNRKDNRTPEEANMPLLFKPYTPTKMELMGL